MIPVETTAQATPERIKELGIVLGPVIGEGLEAQVRMKGQVKMPMGEWHAVLTGTFRNVEHAATIGDIRLARLKAMQLAAGAFALYEQLLTTPERKPATLVRNAKRKR